jgi:hypothetical protein
MWITVFAITMALGFVLAAIAIEYREQSIVPRM